MVDYRIGRQPRDLVAARRHHRSGGEPLHDPEMTAFRDRVDRCRVTMNDAWGARVRRARLKGDKIGRKPRVVFWRGAAEPDGRRRKDGGGKSGCKFFHSETQSDLTVATSRISKAVARGDVSRQQIDNDGLTA